ncbi:MAG: hypothetical protein ACJA2W_001601 [Planctomycetota bacterium]|jgi:hypothetical protein
MNSTTSSSVSRAASTSPDARTAIAEIAERLGPATAKIVCFFAAPTYDREALTAAIAEHFAGSTVIGCTTAGEFGPAGYQEGSLSAFALSEADFDVEVVRIDNLAHMEIDSGSVAMTSAMMRMRDRGRTVDADHCFSFLLVDGLSMREEALVSSLHLPLGDICQFGGSAGDDLHFERTQVFHGGRFHDDAAVVLLVHTELPFEVFRTQHFVETDKRMVITEADPLTRTVTEINAEPAAREYARQVGLEISELTPQVFATHPVLVKVGAETFIRSIARVNDDESLTFFCAIEAGNVLTVAKGVDLVKSLELMLDEVRGRVGAPQLTIGCDCILRSLEAKRCAIRDRVAEVLDQSQAVGFTTYGEQVGSMHVNQTFTGVMIGSGIA